MIAKAIAETYVRMFDEPFAFGTKGQYPVDIESLSDEAIVAQWRYGKRLYNDRWNSSEDKEKGKPEKDFFADFIKRLGFGIGTGSRGPSGPRADAEGLADVEWLKKAYGKTSQKTLENDWLSFTAVLLIKGGKAGTKDPDLMTKAQATVEGVKAQARATKAWLAFKAAADVKTGEMEETSFVPTFE